MKRLDVLLFLLLLPAAGFVAVQAVHAPRVTSVTQAAVLDTMDGAVSLRGRSRPMRMAELVMSDVAPEPVRDLENIRRRLREGERGTYISEILTQRDSALARWPERIIAPLRIWVADGVGLRDWDESYAQRVREAFTEWSALGIPVRFTFVTDSADADIHVVWTEQFQEPISGKTLWARDRHWWIVNGQITLALHHNEGEALDASAIKAIALHEVGHLLGLDHTADTANIMTPKVRVRALSDMDRATIRLLYSVPPGSIKG